MELAETGKTSNAFGEIPSIPVLSSGVRRLEYTWSTWSTRYTCLRALSRQVRGDVRCRKPLTASSGIEISTEVTTLKTYSLSKVNYIESIVQLPSE